MHFRRSYSNTETHPSLPQNSPQPCASLVGEQRIFQFYRANNNIAHIRPGGNLSTQRKGFKKATWDSPGHQEKLSEHIKPLVPLHVGDSVRIQNRTGHHPNKWDCTGIVIEVQQFHQYLMDQADRHSGTNLCGKSHWYISQPLTNPSSMIFLVSQQPPPTHLTILPPHHHSFNQPSTHQTHPNTSAPQHPRCNPTPTCWSYPCWCCPFTPLNEGKETSYMAILNLDPDWLKTQREIENIDL